MEKLWNSMAFKVFRRATIVQRESAQELLMGLTADKSASSRRHRSTDGSNFSISAKYKIYKERWLVLAVCCLLALSNAMQWISYSSLTAQAEVYYRGRNTSSSSEYTVAWVTNEIFQLVAVITGFGGMYITDHYGILVAALLGTSLNICGSVVRLVSSIPTITSFIARETLLHSGSVVVAAAQAFFLVLPSKIAECWFADNQRAVANVLSFIANPGGVALGTVVPSLLFGEDTSSFTPHSWMFFVYSFGMAVLALLPFIMSLFMRRGTPKTPPSASSAQHIEPPAFWKSIFYCLTNIQFLIQMSTFALAFALLWSLMMFTSVVLDDQGYSLQGYPTAVCAIVGTVTSLVAGHIADRTKKFKEILRFCSVGFALSVIAMRCYLLKRYSSPWDSVVVMTISGAMGAFSIPQFPIGVEMGVETTFPILEATSSGLLVIFAQLWMFVMGWLIEDVSKFDWIYHPAKGAKNWQLSLDVSIVLSLFAVFLTLVCMNPRYRRLELETSVNSANATATANDAEMNRVEEEQQ